MADQKATLCIDFPAEFGIRNSRDIEIMQSAHTIYVGFMYYLQIFEFESNKVLNFLAKASEHISSINLIYNQ